MFERTFSLALIFCLLAGGTLAIGSELFSVRREVTAGSAAMVAVLPRVVVEGKKAPAAVAVATAEGHDSNSDSGASR